MKSHSSEHLLAKLGLVSAGLLLASALSVSASDYSDAVLADNPNIYYRFSSTGTTVTDSGSGGVNGTATSTATQGVTSGPVPTAYSGFDASNKAITFDGSQSSPLSYVSVNNNSIIGQINGSSAVSLEMWINPTTLADVGLIAIPLRTQFASFASGLQIDLYSDGDIRLAGRSQAGDSFGSYIFDSTGITADSWTHLVAVFDYASNDTELYLNGELFGTSTSMGWGSTTLTMDTGSSGDVWDTVLGIKGNLSAGYTGLMDEVAIYDYGLSSTEISSHYAAAIPEPSVYAFSLAMVLLLGALVVRRRRR